MPVPGGWRTQFVALAAIWGSSFLFIKVLDRHWSPTWVALGRVALGAATLVVLVYARGERLRVPRSALPHILIAALFLNAIPFTLFAYGERHVSSIVAGLWNASAPLWVLAFVLLVFGDEQLTRTRAAGLAFGFVGVVLLLGPWRGLGDGEAVGHLACAGAALCYGIGFPYARRFVANRPESGVVLAAAQLLCATAVLAVFTPFTATPTVHIGAGGVLSILVLGILGTGVAYVLNYAILRAAGATTAATVTYVVPVFSTVLGAVVLGETLHWNQPAGAVVLLIGIAISRMALPDRQLRRQRRLLLARDRQRVLEAAPGRPVHDALSEHPRVQRERH
jgi:drug/metabolite transporter (DMT)-like permease